MFRLEKIRPQTICVLSFFLFALLLLPAKAKSKDNPQTIIIRNCLSAIDRTNSARIDVKGFYHDEAGNKTDFSFNGAIIFPGNLEGNLKVHGAKINKEGSVICIDGMTFLLKPNDKNWRRIETNKFHEYDNNPLFKCLKMLLNLSYEENYLLSPLEHGDKTIDDQKCNYFKFEIDLAKLRAKASNPNQPTSLKHFSDMLTGKKATAELWIDKKTGLLMKLVVDVDGWGKSKKPLSGSVTLTEYNVLVLIEKPKYVM